MFYIGALRLDNSGGGHLFFKTGYLTRNSPQYLYLIKHGGGTDENTGKPIVSTCFGSLSGTKTRQSIYRSAFSFIRMRARKSRDVSGRFVICDKASLSDTAARRSGSRPVFSKCFRPPARVSRWSASRSRGAAGAFRARTQRRDS